ncbi:MAG: hypothetical protein ACREJC_10830 [Tepidisphaeraceae bacterium]
MPRHDHRCQSCGAVFEALVKWDDCSSACACGGTGERIYLPVGATHVIDDTLPGGARWMHNLGDTPVWVETKTQYRQELQARGLVPADRKAYNKNDRSPYTSRTRLRPGAHDPFLTSTDD